MDLRVGYRRVKNQEEAFDQVSDHITPELLERFNIRVNLKYDRRKYLIKASGSAFTMSFSFVEKEVLVDLDLPFFLKGLKKKILPIVERELQGVL